MGKNVEEIIIKEKKMINKLQITSKNFHSNFRGLIRVEHRGSC